MKRLSSVAITARFSFHSTPQEEPYCDLRGLSHDMYAYAKCAEDTEKNQPFPKLKCCSQSHPVQAAVNGVYIEP